MRVMTERAAPSRLNGAAQPRDDRWQDPLRSATLTEQFA
jgi:hypothetical protein